MSLLKPIEIGKFYTQNNVFVAPLAGISDNPFRTIVRRFGAGLTFTGMVSSYGIIRGDKSNLDLLIITDAERPAGVQIFGEDPLTMGSAASICNQFQFDLLDINCGCSVLKVFKTGAGAGILSDPYRLYRVVHACVHAQSRPVSVKLRLGVSSDRINVIENASAAQEAGASLITLHPRTADEGYRGQASWEYIAMVKDLVRIPVCGNGDIRTPADAIRMVCETGCDAVMVGRGAVGNPWLIRDIIDAFMSYPECNNDGHPYRYPENYPGEVKNKTPGVAERLRCAVEHLKLMVRFKGEERALKDAKHYLHHYLRGFSGAADLRKSLMKAGSVREFFEIAGKLINADTLC